MYDDLVKLLKDFAAELRKAEDALLVLDAADAIEDLEFACKRYKKYKALCEYLTKWIPVTERLPEDDTICILTNGVAEAIGYRGKVFGWHLIWTDYLVEGEVTHWMPLPEPPNEE